MYPHQGPGHGTQSQNHDTGIAAGRVYNRVDQVTLCSPRMDNNGCDASRRRRHCYRRAPHAAVVETMRRRFGGNGQRVCRVRALGHCLGFGIFLPAKT